MVSKQVSYHQDTMMLLGQGDQLRRISQIEAEGFLHTDILAGRQRCFSKLIMSYSRRSNGDFANGRLMKNFFDGSCFVDIGVLRTEVIQCHLIGIADRMQGTQSMKVARQMLAPVPDTDQSQVTFS